jgi:hypothetical protein
VESSDPDGDVLTVVFYGRQLLAEGDFTLVVMPDTEDYTDDKEWAKGIFTAQTAWIRDVAQGNVVNADAPDVAFVSHAGDIVHKANDAYFQRADAAISLMDGATPYGLVRGNHDKSAFFNQYFPFTRYAGEGWYGGHYGSTNNNSYQLFSAGGADYLVLHLEYLPSDAVIVWANGVLQAHQDRKAIVVTHAYLSTSGGRDLGGISTGYIWKKLVKPNANVFLVLCGHAHGVYTRTDVVEGRTVYQLLANFQEWTNGGNGFLRLLRFSPSQGRIHVKTYSPWLDQYRTENKHQFQLEMPYTEIGRVSGVASGTRVQVEWAGIPDSVQCEWYACAIDSRGRSTRSPVWSFDTQPLGLLAAAAINQPPVVESCDPAGGLTVAAGLSHRFEVWCHDAEGESLEYKWMVDGLPCPGEAAWWHYAPTADDRGMHIVEVVVSDGAGGSCRQAWTVTVD